MKYKIITIYGPKEVEGEPVKFKGFEDWDFFVHPLWSLPDLFVVSEKSTGYRFPVGDTDKKKAIAKTRRFLLSRGHALTKKNINKARKQAKK